MQKNFVAYSIIVLALVAGFLVVYTRKANSITQHADPARYYAVFLSNDQVYFAHIDEENQDAVVLKDVYYLKTNTNAVRQGEATEAATAKVSLIKLGKELHQPQEPVVINREHVLFYEPIGNDGEVMKAIIAHQAQK
ncbi:MAG: hypothetical protein AAB515_03380 [Patescibacteria group bacterium]